MINFDDIISGDYSKYPEEIQSYMKNYSGLLREKIKEELIKNKSDILLNSINKNNEAFMTILTEILENGTKGYNDMSTKTLIDMYLNIKNCDHFVALLETINKKTSFD